MIEGVLKQLNDEGKADNLKIAGIKPHRSEPYFLVTINTLVVLLGAYLEKKTNKEEWQTDNLDSPR